MVLESIVWIGLEIRQDGLDLLDCLIVFVLIETRIGEGQVNELHCRLEVLPARFGGYAVGKLVDVRGCGYLLACEHLLER